MKRAVIIHCWGGTSQYAWYPWAKAELEKQGYQVIVPDMPNTEEPKLKEWLPKLQEVIGTPDEELVLIGHSLGTVTIMRYLENLPAGQRVKKAILVAAFSDSLGFKELENFFKAPLELPKIKPKTENGFVVIQSDNDPYIAEQYGRQLEEELGAKLIIKHNAGHMSGAIDSDKSCTKLPEVVDNL